MSPGEDAHNDRLNLASELLQQGKFFSYRDVSFYLDRAGEPLLCIEAKSDWKPELTTEFHASDKIEYAKSVFDDLKSRSNPFNNLAAQLPHEFWVCHDYGDKSSSVALAKESKGKFEWLFV